MTFHLAASSINGLALILMRVLRLIIYFRISMRASRIIDHQVGAFNWLDQLKMVGDRPG